MFGVLLPCVLIYGGYKELGFSYYASLNYALCLTGLWGILVLGMNLLQLSVIACLMEFHVTSMLRDCCCKDSSRLAVIYKALFIGLCRV